MPQIVAYSIVVVPCVLRHRELRRDFMALATLGIFRDRVTLLVAGP
jgi:hypothetical protein